MKSVEEYAIVLLTSGAESHAEDDLNEDGEIAEHAIKRNPQAFWAWFASVQHVKEDV